MSVSRAGAVAAYHGEIVRPLVEILGERLLVLVSERCGRPPLQADGSFRLVAEVDDAPEQPDVAFAQLLLNTRGPRRTTAKVTEVIWGSRFRIHELVADQYRAGRVLLAGDLRCDNPEVDSRSERRSNVLSSGENFCPNFCPRHPT